MIESSEMIATSILHKKNEHIKRIMMIGQVHSARRMPAC